MDDKDSLNNLLLGALLVAIIIGLSLIYVMTHPEQTETLKAEPIVKEQSAETMVKKTVGGHEKVKVTVAEPDTKNPIMTDEELIAMVVQAEAGNQPMVGKVAVAAVVLNRCDQYGLTVETVVYAENQFDIADTYTKEDLRAVEIAQDNRDLFPEDLLFFRAGDYHTFGKKWQKIGDHYFSTIGD